MDNKWLTEPDLRARWTGSKGQVFQVEEGTSITPAARDFIKEQKLELVFTKSHIRQGKTDPPVMSRTPVPVVGGRPMFVDAATGAEMSEKPEEMTHLRGNLLVPKTHPRILFRGKLDTVMAQLLCIAAEAMDAGEARISADLQELLEYTRTILGAEVKEEPLPTLRLLGQDSAGIRRMSHHVKEQIGIDHPIPEVSMGVFPLKLNLLRTQIRETELAAAAAFTDENGTCTRKDIVEGLNRLSSCVYIIFCRKLAGYYNK